MALDQIFFMRPVPGWSRYHTPIDNLYLCGSGTHPGGGITGLPGYFAAKEDSKEPRPQQVDSSLNLRPSVVDEKQFSQRLLRLIQ